VEPKRDGCQVYVPFEVHTGEVMYCGVGSIYISDQWQGQIYPLQDFPISFSQFPVQEPM
jgi:hypothetical protein